MAKRFSLTSLAGTFQFSYIVILLVLALTFVLVVWKVNSLFKEHEELYAMRSTKYHASELRNSLNHSFMLLQLYAQYDTVAHAEEIYYQTAIDIFFDKTLSSFDSIQTLTEGELEGVIEIKTVMNPLIIKYKHLRETTEKGDPLRNYLRLDMTGLVLRINKDIEKLIIDEENTEIMAREVLKTDIMRNNYLVIPVFIFVLGLTYYLGRRSLTKVIEGLKSIYRHIKSISQGEIPENIIVLPNEFGKTLTYIRKLSEGIEEIKELAQEVGKRNFKKEIDIFPEDSELGEALQEMKLSLEQVAKAEQERNWQNQGVVEMGKVIRKHTEDVQILCDEFLSNLISYLDAQQGAIFLPTEGEKILLLHSVYAYGRKKFIEREARSDEGVLGEVFQDGERVLMTDIPDSYAFISAGLGEAKPNCVLTVPLKAQENILGVLEVASFSNLTEFEIQFVERSADILAASISSVANAEKMRNLLQKSEYSTQQMKSQEEELRQNTEELIATREELERQLLETQNQVAEKDNIFENSNQAFIFVDASGRIFRVNYSFTQLLEFPKEEVLGDPISKLIPDLRGLNRHAKRDSERVMYHIYHAQNRNKQDVTLLANVTRLEINKEIMFMIGLAAMPTQREFDKDAKKEISLLRQN